MPIGLVIVGRANCMHPKFSFGQQLTLHVRRGEHAQMIFFVVAEATGVPNLDVDDVEQAVTIAPHRFANRVTVKAAHQHLAGDAVPRETLHRAVKGLSRQFRAGVDTSGSGKTKIKSGAIDFNDDEAGAIAYAVMDAITDGGITGVSARIQKALASSDDLDEALEEALKVQEVEDLLGGLGATIAKEFKSFEATAKERVRIATEYGFDVLAIEKKNAEDRAALIESLLEDQVGSLQKLVEEMTYGSLFEGSAIEQRDALLKEIATAQADVDAGKDGAADTLASLFEKLLEVSEEAYGSTGQYAADRDMILKQSQAAIDAAYQRITEASAAASSTSTSSASDPALETTNQALDENNDQNARILAELQSQTAALAALSAATGSSILDLTELARTS